MLLSGSATIPPATPQTLSRRTPTHGGGWTASAPPTDAGGLRRHIPGILMDDRHIHPDVPDPEQIFPRQRGMVVQTMIEPAMKLRLQRVSLLIVEFVPVRPIRDAHVVRIAERREIVGERDQNIIVILAVHGII